MVGWVGRAGRGGYECTSVGCPRDGLGWAGLGLRPVLREGGNQREDGGTYLVRMNGSVTGWGAKAVA